MVYFEPKFIRIFPLESISCKTVEAQEREIERALVKHVTQFLLELGAGFAFVGRQVLLQVGEE
ncbi:PDDEXK nuclease domain-containing protein, partial [Limnospira fusiformis]